MASSPSPVSTDVAMHGRSRPPSSLNTSISSARVVQEVGPGGDDQGGQPNRERIVVVGVRVGRGERRVPVREQRNALLREEGPHLGGTFQALRVGEVDHEQRRAGRLERVHDPRHRVVAA